YIFSHTSGFPGINLNKAMTIDEAQAFVGDEPCNIKTLTETDLYCEPPEVQPQPKKRQKRDTINNLPEFIVARQAGHFSSSAKQNKITSCNKVLVT
uniref:Uncharacterized protein n=1 Tax=Strix occidentalis caurina TaxID=311401 RepID=A0A8D0G1F9_STROC